jgi:tetratricopeptide (TPR) repeat protein
MKLKIVALVFLLFIVSLASGQVKFRVKKLNADSLVALIPEKEGIQKIDALNLLSNVISRKSPDSSAILANQAITLSGVQEYKKGLADGYFNLGNAYYLLDTLDPTISNYLKALRIYENLEPSQEYGNLCIQLLLINYFTGRYEDVFTYGWRALETYNKIEDRKGIFTATYSIGVLKVSVAKDWDSAIYFYNKALSFLDPATDQNEIAYIYADISQVYANQYDKPTDTLFINKSIRYSLKALDLPKITPEVKAWICVHLGGLYLTLYTDSSIAKGREYYEKLDQIADSCFDAYDFKSWIYSDYGYISYDRHEYNKAISFFKQAIDLVKERIAGYTINDYKEPTLGHNWRMYMKGIKSRSYHQLYEIYMELGDYRQALDYYILSQESKDEVFLEQNQKLITMMEASSKDEKTKSQIELLARDNELKALAIKQSRTLNFGIAGIFVILLLVGLLFLRQNKMKNEHKTVLLEQKLLRLQMNPHFIFNALSNILNFIDGKENEKASNYLTTFSKLLRTTLESTREDMVPFEKEVGSLRNYLELQKLRYKDKFFYHIEVDENIKQDDMSIPPMLVQPFIENAIEHGIRHKKTPGRIDVRFILKGKKILCEVEDDGVGREKAWETEVKERTGHKSLATEIINDRIKALNKKFRNKIQLQIIDKISENAETTGTKVLLDLPYGSVYE